MESSRNWKSVKLDACLWAFGLSGVAVWEAK